MERKKKKKILFMVINMNIGGTEKALLNMLDEIPEEQYDITLLMLEEFGGFLEAVQNHVTIQYLDGYEKIKRSLEEPPYLLAKNYISNWKLSKGINHFFYHTMSKVFNDRSSYFEYLLKNCERDTTEYDIAVAYAGPMDFISYYIAKKIKAKRKIQWIHFDVSKIGFNLSFAKKFYPKFDKVFVVSNTAREKIIKYLPHLSEKIETFYNTLSPSSINKLAKQGEGFRDNFKGTRILTVGRLSKEKGQDIAIQVCAMLKKSGYNIRWYCIGEGNARKEYENLIIKYDVAEEFVLLGSQSNPYPYMDQCDIYVQPSRYEGFCITLSEAKCFKSPIVITNFTGASEQITNEINGLIVSIEKKEIYLGITKILNNNKLIDNLKNALCSENLDKNNDLQKLYNIFEM
ncbi:glycosyltransferase [Bacillus alkalicellulosilyticus]|uniref:glycosyltransferase n=1 Tax=Alkalihalobacterium alkalicellulosilyticum TaxID=1912214 RepID=UPI000998AD37|nr:glycosyltransferase [Bacillus alkalicellulosilyticus]